MRVSSQGQRSSQRKRAWGRREQRSEQMGRKRWPSRLEEARYQASTLTRHLKSVNKT